MAIGTTLTVQGITWASMKYNGKLALGYRKHAIAWDCGSGKYHILEEGRSIFSDSSVTACLENAAALVWDYYASKIIPSWEVA